MTVHDWIAVFTEVGEEVRARTASLIGTEAGRAELSRGAGGDVTIEIDRLAEERILERLKREAGRGERFSVLSEETGHVRHGADWPLILVDPVDGSLNAKQGIPVFALMITLLDGPTLGDALAGCVLNLATGERFTAIRGAGARRNGARLRPLPVRRGGADFEVVALESSPRSTLRSAPLLERAAKVRILGSMALSIAYAATGAVDVFVAPFRARAFDMSASLLVLRELGGVATDLGGRPLEGLAASLGQRTSLVCSSDAGCHRRALELLQGA